MSTNEEYEIEGLISQENVVQNDKTTESVLSRSSRSTGSTNLNRKSFKNVKFILAFVVGAFSLVGTNMLFHSDDGFSPDKISKAVQGKNSGLPHLTCPSENDTAPSLNDNVADGETISEFYEKEDIVSNKTLSSFTLEDIAKLKNESYDGWKRTFHTNKKNRRSWKKRMFKSLKSGDTIFESACGRGFNLLITAEVLKEEYGIDGLNMYGIEYVQRSVEIAKKVLDVALEPIGSNLGLVCRADATNLSFIEDESFDLAFTGYIDQIVDPLDLASELGHALEADDICGRSSWAEKKLQKLDQRAQEDWFSAWVMELIRITKKGNPVIVEKVSLPMCDDPEDWGGVSMDWWTKAVAIYGWDVDVDSILIEGQVKGRYDVFMRRNK